MSKTGEEDTIKEEEKYCKICGHVLNPKYIYCVKCGARIRG